MGKRKHSINSSCGDENDDSNKRMKSRGVSFGDVTIYHFPRKQGFVSVPSTGGSTLGMARKHACIEKVQLDQANGSESDDRKPFAQISQRARRNILKTAGVRRIVKREERDCAEIRLSRIICGCNCGDICSSETCECILSGIGCQVDYGRFPCSCQPNGCQNDNGRKQYNPSAVEKHYFETFARINGQNVGTAVLKYVGVEIS
ncbi:cysteine/serine-rich nuclear protein 1-like [Montipora capricornis]|uniref:cysteine/serine-rich nuclear protein 1-like n=1 Tax=Montipora capricornis TaxID=246305 RepID=UPI0035F1E1C1